MNIENAHKTYRYRTIVVPAHDYYGKFGLLRRKLKNSGAVEEFAGFSSPVTDVWAMNDGFDWPDKDPLLLTLCTVSFRAFKAAAPIPSKA
jgi:hypothetical protein